MTSFSNKIMNSLIMTELDLPPLKMVNSGMKLWNVATMKDKI